MDVKMKNSQRAALGQYLSEVPEGYTYSEILEFIEQGSDEVLVSKYYENAPASQLVEDIENTQEFLADIIRSSGGSDIDPPPVIVVSIGEDGTIENVESNFDVKVIELNNKGLADQESKQVTINDTDYLARSQMFNAIDDQDYIQGIVVKIGDDVEQASSSRPRP